MSENAKQAQEMPEIRLTLTPDEVREENNEKLEELEQKQENRYPQRILWNPLF